MREPFQNFPDGPLGVRCCIIAPMDTPAREADVAAIESVVGRFFAGFVSGADSAAAIAGLREVLHPRAVIVRTCGQEPEVYDVDGFIAPREALLASGELTDFREWPTSGRTDVFGDIAQHWCTYAKSWRQGGEQVSGAGVKSLQLVRTDRGWRISAIVWDDEV